MSKSTCNNNFSSEYKSTCNNKFSSEYIAFSSVICQSSD